MRAGKTGEIPIGMWGWSGMPRVQRQLPAVPMGFTKVFFSCAKLLWLDRLICGSFSLCAANQ